MDDQGEKIFEKRFGTLSPDLDELHNTLTESGCGKEAMESTSIYWMPIWRVFGFRHGRTVNRHGKQVICHSLNGVIGQADVEMLKQCMEQIELIEKQQATCLTHL